MKSNSTSYFLYVWHYFCSKISSLKMNYDVENDKTFI